MYHNHPGDYSTPSWDDLRGLGLMNLYRSQYLNLESDNPVVSKVLTTTGIFSMSINYQTLEEIGREEFISGMNEFYQDPLLFSGIRTGGENGTEIFGTGNPDRFCHNLTSPYATFTFEARE